MTSLILTHNLYAVASLITLTLGSFYISSHIHQRWLSSYKLSLIDTNAIIKLLIVSLGFTIISWKALFDTAAQLLPINILSGCIIGVVLADAEKYILKYVPKTHLISPQKNKNIIKSIKKIRISYSTTIIVGICEEILYRGYMTILCQNSQNTTFTAISLITITMFFSLSHLGLGNIHVLTKFILGFTCLLSFLYTKTILTPICIHATFNALVTNKLRKLAYE